MYYMVHIKEDSKIGWDVEKMLIVYLQIHLQEDHFI